MAFNCCTEHKTSQGNIIIHMKIMQKITSEQFKNQEGVFYNAEIVMLNNSDSIFNFWTMSCSWEENWLFSTNSLNLYNRGCDNNSPIIKVIEPGKEITYEGVVQIYEDSTIVKKSELKLGFILIGKDETIDGTNFRKILVEKLQKRKGIMWSEPFTIDK